MAIKKTSSKKDGGYVIPSVDMKIAGTGVIKIKDLIAKLLVIQKISSLLSILFFLVWIPIGVFFLWFIVANFKLGAFDQLMQPKQNSATDAASQSQNIPTETSLPGVGKVNIACVQANLTEDAISRMLEGGGTEKLTDEEKTKLEPCVVEKETDSAETSPAPGQ